MKVQTKKYAYFLLQDKQIPVSEALRLRNSGKIENKKNNPVFFDFRNPNIRSGVYPISSSEIRSAHYRYFNENNKVNISYPKEMTNAHLFFQMMFLELNKFSIEDKENKKKVRVAVNSAELEFYIKTEGRNGILIDVLLDIKQTYPYSYKYLWNNKLAIEVKVTHAVDPKKTRILRENNIATYEVTVPSKIRRIIPENHKLLDSEELRQKKVDELIKIYENDEKWLLFGNFIANSKVDDVNKENYLLLSQFERELDKYKKEKEELNKEIQNYKDYKLQLSREINKLIEQSNTLEKLNDNNQKLLSDSHKNEQLVKKLSIELKQKEQKIESLAEENNLLKNNMSKLNNESFLQWFKRKLIKK